MVSLELCGYQPPFVAVSKSVSVWPWHSCRPFRAFVRAESMDKSPGKKLRLFIDSAKLEEWKKWLPTGVFHGVTTTPMQLEKANVLCHPKRLGNFAAEALKLGAEEVQLQAWGKTVENYVGVGMDLARIDNSIVVKVPATAKGVEAARKLVKQGVRVNLVGIYSFPQVLIALAAGVEYASTACVKLMDNGKTEEDIKKMQVAIKNLGGTLKLLVENLNNMDQIENLTSCGIGSVALPIPLVEQLFGDTNTEREATEQEAAALRNPYRLFF